jgi:hypothetical protein
MMMVEHLASHSAASMVELRAPPMALMKVGRRADLAVDDLALLKDNLKG